MRYYKLGLRMVNRCGSLTVPGSNAESIAYARCDFAAVVTSGPAFVRGCTALASAALSSLILSTSRSSKGLAFHGFVYAAFPGAEGMSSLVSAPLATPPGGMTTILR